MTNHPHRNWRRRLCSEAAALGSDLVSAWIAMYPDDPPRELAAIVAREAQTWCDANRLAQWQRGKRVVPPAVQRVMRRDLCRYLVADDAGDALARVMEPPARRR